jgi:hypothetical protein
VTPCGEKSVHRTLCRVDGSKKGPIFGTFANEPRLIAVVSAHQLLFSEIHLPSVLEKKYISIFAFISFLNKDYLRQTFFIIVLICVPN